jgi:hypothetical protein
MLTGRVTTLAESVAFTASARPVALRTGIYGIVRMPLWAVRCASGKSARANPPEHVLTGGHDLQMVGVDARRVSAEMINDHAVRDWTNLHLIGDPVRLRHTRTGTAAPNLAIATRPPATLPDPARVLTTSSVHLLPEAFCQRPDASRLWDTWWPDVLLAPWLGVSGCKGALLSQNAGSAPAGPLPLVPVETIYRLSLAASCAALLGQITVAEGHRFGWAGSALRTADCGLTRLAPAAIRAPIGIGEQILRLGVQTMRANPIRHTPMVSRRLAGQITQATL